MLALATALTLTAPAKADNWQSVILSDDGMNLIMDVDTWEIFQVENAKDVYYLLAEFKFIYQNGTASPTFWYSTTTAACTAGNGQLFIFENRKSGWEKTSTVWFTKDGTQAFEHGARALCNVWKAKAEKLLNEKNKPPQTPPAQPKPSKKSSNA